MTQIILNREKHLKSHTHDYYTLLHPPHPAYLNIRRVDQLYMQQAT